MVGSFLYCLAGQLAVVAVNKLWLRDFFDILSFSNARPSVPGKFMVCSGHRLQCKMPNCTNHKFPGYGAE